MKPYTISIEIEWPRDKVIKLFDNSDNMFHWQNGLQSFEHLSGEPGQPGATSKLVYLNGNQRIELIETITSRNLPDEFSGTYAWNSGVNTLENRFVELGPNKTRWESTCHYHMKSLFMKIMGWLMPGKFKEQNMKFFPKLQSVRGRRDKRQGVVSLTTRSTHK